MEDPFVLAVDEWIKKVQDRTDKVVREVANQVLARVKELTPVQTGNLRANWTVTLGNSALELSGNRTDESLAVVAQLKSGDIFTILNPVVYARRVEFGFVGVDSLGRHYDQKGRHMLTQTIQELPQLINKAVTLSGSQ